MNWKLLEHKVLYQRYFRLDEYRLRHDRFDGGTHEVVREIFERGSAVAVLPYDAKRDRVVLIEQFRAGAIHFTDKPWLLELVAGIIEEGESLEQVARRETLEEAGCEVGELLLVHHYLVTPGGSTEACALYVANVDSDGLGGIHGLDEEHEDIKVHVVSRERALDMLDNGRIFNAAAVIGLQWLALNYQELQKRWS
ncbi:MAG: NUDIX domain-containing protein [Gammaproteobacteria bacterium]|nr:NUDIX domain-containing protein [Gammaproteobacteria bacterium]